MPAIRDRLSHLLLCFMILTLVVPVLADSVNTTQRTVTKLADGVYSIRHKDAPDQFPQSNTLVVIGERDVLVVDSCYLPSSAREDIAQIRQWTNKSVRFLVNTHWHYDHTMGNGSYAQAFPGLQIIAQSETAKSIAGYNPGWFDRYPKRTVEFKRRLETGKNDDGTPLSEADRKQFTEILPGRDPVAAEFKAAAPMDKYPDLTFDREFSVDLGNRIVQIKHLGRGNTAGDAVVYLPKEKILAAGDLLDHPVPYLGGGYPFDLVKTLQAMAQLDTQIIVPGHGDVLRDKVYLNQVIDLIKTVTDEVSRQVYKVGNGPRNLDAVKKAVLETVDLTPWRKQFAGDSKDDQEFFDGFSINGLITAAYAQVWGR